MKLDIFTLYYQGKLLSEISELSAEELKQICKTHGLDPSGSYKRMDQAQLADFIMYRVDCMINRGGSILGRIVNTR